MTTTLSRARRAFLVLPLALFGFGLFSPANAVPPGPEERGRAMQDAENGEVYCVCAGINHNCDNCGG